MSVMNWSQSWDQNACTAGCRQQSGVPLAPVHPSYIKCKVIGCPLECRPINHDWVECLRLQSFNLRWSPAVLMGTRRWNSGTARAPLTPPSDRHCMCTWSDLTAWDKLKNGFVCDVPFPPVLLNLLLDFVVVLFQSPESPESPKKKSF